MSDIQIINFEIPVEHAVFSPICNNFQAKSYLLNG